MPDNATYPDLGSYVLGPPHGQLTSTVPATEVTADWGPEFALLIQLDDLGSSSPEETVALETQTSNPIQLPDFSGYVFEPVPFVSPGFSPELIDTLITEDIDDPFPSPIISEDFFFSQEFSNNFAGFSQQYEMGSNYKMAIDEVVENCYPVDRLQIIPGLPCDGETIQIPVVHHSPRPRSPKYTPSKPKKKRDSREVPKKFDCRIGKDKTRKISKGQEILNQPSIGTLIYEFSTGKVEGVLYEPRQRVRLPFSEQVRKSVAETRKMKACVSCRMLRKACRPSEGADCKACEKYAAAAAKPGIRILKMPCFRAKITDVTLFRLRPASGSPLLTRRKQVFALEDDGETFAPTRELQITQGQGVNLTISVAEFTPGPGDKTSYDWSDETGPHKLDMPRYCITNIEEAKKCMMEYVVKSRSHYLEPLLDSGNSILRDTFNFANHPVEFGFKVKHKIVQKALNLWSASRIIERTWRLCGDDTLDLKPIEDPKSPWKGIIPVTPIMDTQLDQIVIQGVLKPLWEELLRELQEKVYQNKKENWFEIFLTTFILMSNMEWTLAHTRRFARTYGMKGRYGYYGQQSPYEAYFHGAKILLYHFHSICKGWLPLKHDWESPNSGAIAGMDADEVKYMVKLKNKIEQQGDKMILLRKSGEYETELFWSHQLFFDNWKAEPYNEEEEDSLEALPVH